MNEWIMAGLVVVGTILAMGGGGWIVSLLFRKRDDGKKDKA